MFKRGIDLNPLPGVMMRLECERKKVAKEWKAREDAGQLASSFFSFHSPARRV